MAESLIDVDVMSPAASKARAAIVTFALNFAFSLNECEADVPVFVSLALTRNSTLEAPTLHWLAPNRNDPSTVAPSAAQVP